MLVCTHVITLSLQYECVNLPIYRYFKQLPDPKGPLCETLPSASIKAANEAVHAGHFETTERVTVQISALRPRSITIFANIFSGK